MIKTLKERIARLEAKQPETQGIDGFFVIEYGMTDEQARAEYERQHPGCDFDRVVFIEGA